MCMCMHPHSFYLPQLPNRLHLNALTYRVYIDIVHNQNKRYLFIIHLFLIYLVDVPRLRVSDVISSLMNEFLTATASTGFSAF